MVAFVDFSVVAAACGGGGSGVFDRGDAAFIDPAAVDEESVSGYRR